MRYLVPSIGRCASSVMAHQLHKAAGSADWQYCQDYAGARDTVIKTHAPFTGEPPYEYRAVYCMGRIGDVIASMYAGMDGHLSGHLGHLGLSDIDRLKISTSKPLRNTLGWRVLIDGDRFGFKRNIESWRQSQNVLFVHYDQWEADPIQTFSRVSAFVGLPVVPREITPRRGRLENLPQALQDAIRREYGALA